MSSVASSQSPIALLNLRRQDAVAKGICLLRGLVAHVAIREGLVGDKLVVIVLVESALLGM